MYNEFKYELRYIGEGRVHPRTQELVRMAHTVDSEESLNEAFRLTLETDT